ncbi:MAG: hypothetical protein ACI8RD_005643 [Bacillariaceae sp.]|jgi:hypothetical protein
MNNIFSTNDNNKSTTKRTQSDSTLTSDTSTRKNNKSYYWVIKPTFNLPLFLPQPLNVTGN